MNNWFVANDAGKVAGSDMSEMAAKLLASELKAKKTYFISYYYNGADDGLISADNEPCNSVDFAMTFETEEEANEMKDKLQKEWVSKLSVDFIADDSWEAFNGDDKE